MQTLQQCIKCLEAKDLSQFYYHTRIGKNGTYIQYRTKCKKCVNKESLTKQRTYRAVNADKVRANANNYRKQKLLTDPIYRAKVNAGQRSRYERYAIDRMLRNAKVRANKNGLDFTLNPDNLVIPDICPILQIPLFTGTKGDYSNSPSLDRIDNTKGYVDGNVAIISSLANSMKNCATIEQLQTFAKNIGEYIKDIVQTVEKDN